MKKSVAILLFGLFYAISFGAGIALFAWLISLGMHYLWSLLLADVLATTLIYVFGLIVKSPSLYDPYWSVQTLIFYVFLLCYYGNWNFGTILMMLPLTFYTVRLTLNFFIGFSDFNYIDWRYRMLRKKSGPFFQFVNYIGIHMVPTLVVFLASIPLFVYAKEWNFHYVDILAIIVSSFGVALELIADTQMKSFIKTRSSRAEILEHGIWKYSRHPNYLGENLVWIGFSLVLFGRLESWYWFVGIIAMLMLFLCISIPLAESNMATYKEGFDDYKKRVSPLLLWPPKKKGE